MQRQPSDSSYDYSQQYQSAAMTKQYPIAHATSSAFSASANPNEDWTKISDLAERRRIQNRIAQRNYRKKLKKRLEDLERRAGSGSASPEEAHEELPEDGEDDEDAAQTISTSTRRRSGGAATLNRHDRTPEMLAQQYMIAPDDRSMFSQQHLRQLSTSPPPFYAPAMPVIGGDAYSHFQPHAASYCTPGGSGYDMPLYPQYMPAQQASAPRAAGQIKQEYYGDDEISPFSMSYASMAGGGEATSPAYHHHNLSAYTSPSLESYDHGSPPELQHWAPLTPPMPAYGYST